MARMCEICGKKPMAGNHVSHAHNRTPRRFLPNLQKVRVVKEGGTILHEDEIFSQYQPWRAVYQVGTGG